MSECRSLAVVLGYM